MREAMHQRHFIRNLYTIIQAKEAEGERSEEVGDAVATYAAALNEVAGMGGAAEGKRASYVEGHLASALNQILALKNQPMVDQITHRVCDTAMHALNNE